MIRYLAIIEIGAGTAIPTIRNKGKVMANTYENIKLIRINPRDFKVYNEDNEFSIPFGGLEGLKKVL